jgi:putative copper resistance protein D
VIEALVLARWVHFAASLLAAGTVCFMVVVAQPAAAAVGADLGSLYRRWFLMVWSALAVAIISGAVWLVLLASDILGASILDVCLGGGALSVLTETRFGTLWTARLGLALLLAVLLLWPRAALLHLAAAVGLVVLLAWIGHAGATLGPAGTVHLASDIGHLMAAAAWLGSLPALALLLAWTRKASVPEGFAARATARFSRLGMLSVAVLLASGIVNSWLLLSGPRDLWATDYGRLVSLKVLLFVAMVGIAAVNRFHLSPRLRAASALRSLQRNSWAETGLGLVILLLVGALGTMAPSKHIHPVMTQVPPDAAYVHIHTSAAMADVTINPGKAGQTDVTIRISQEDFTELFVQSVRLVLDAPANGPSIDREATRAADGTWQIAGISVSEPGVWTARVFVTPTIGRPIVLDAPVVIEP